MNIENSLNLSFEMDFVSISSEFNPYFSLWTLFMFSVELKIIFVEGIFSFWAINFDILVLSSFPVRE